MKFAKETGNLEAEPGEGSNKTNIGRVLVFLFMQCVNIFSALY